MFWGRKWYIFTEAVYFLCVTCLNVSSIVDTAQVVDTFVGHWVWKGAVALQITSTSAQIVWWNPLSCTQEQLASGECIPFEQHGGMLLTVGYVITIALFLPLALMDLKVQYEPLLYLLTGVDECVCNMTICAFIAVDTYSLGPLSPNCAVFPPLSHHVYLLLLRRKMSLGK